MKKIIIASLTGILMALFTLPVLADSLLFEKSEYAARREKFMQQIPDGIAVIQGSVKDAQNNDFKYFCGIDVPGAILIVDGIREESLLFYTTSEHYLNGEGLSSELASNPVEATGIKKYYPIALAMLFLSAPSENSDFTSRSTDTLGSPFSILATLD